MRIVIDTNILISAIIRNSTTRHLLISLLDEMYFPVQSFDEVLKYKKEIIKKAGLSQEEFNAILRVIFRNIRVVPQDEMLESSKQAQAIMDRIDPKDTIFIALALAKKAVIWSNDGDFKEQTSIPVVTTEELIKGYTLLKKKFEGK